MGRTHLIALTVVLLIVVMSLSGCAPQAPLPAAPAPAPAPAEDKVFELKYNDWGPEGLTPGRFAKEAIQMIYERTNGRVRITPYFSETLLKFGDTFPGVSTGIADMALYVSSHSKGVHDLNLIFSRQFAEEAPTYLGVSRAYTELLETMPEIQQEMEKTGIRWLSVVSLPPSHLNTVNKPVRVPADLRGMKITSAADAALMVNNIGGSAVTLPPMDWYSALETGLTEGQFMHWPGIYGFKLLEVLRYHTLFGPGGSEASAYGHVINLDTWNSLPKEYQEIIVEAFNTVNYKHIEHHQQTIENTLAAAKAQGNTIIELTPEERALWAEYMREINEQWIADTEAKGFPAQEAYDELMRLFDKHRDATF